MSEPTELSERELEILRLVATGASNKEIAQQLYISANTVKVHLRNIFAKIGATTRTEAAMYAVQTGLVPSGSEPSQAEDLGSAQAVEASALHSQLAPAPLSVWQRSAPWLAAALLLVLLPLAVIILPGWFTPRPAVSGQPQSTEAARWQTRAGLAEPRFGLAVTAFENRLFAFGGESLQGVSGAVDQYDPQINTWMSGAEKPTPAADVLAGVAAGKIYLPGGRLESGEITDRLEIYDPYTDEWSRGSALPEARSAYALAVFEGKLYLFGGWDGKVFVRSTFRYDPGEDLWEILDSMPTARGFAGAAVAESKIFVVGGTDGDAPLDVNEVYWPAREGSQENVWTKAAAMPEGRSAMGITSVVDLIYLFGGEGKTPGAVSSLEYIPSLDAWQEFVQPETSPWSRMGVVLLGSQVYLLGGKLDQAPTGQNLAYRAIYTISIPTIIKDQ